LRLRLRLRWLCLRLRRRRTLRRAQEIAERGMTLLKIIFGDDVSEEQAARPGLYHFVREGAGEKCRIHLRVDEHGAGTLILNADRVLHLNATAAAMARGVLEGASDQQIINGMAGRFRVNARQLRQDIADVREQLELLVQADGPCPIHGLELETSMPFSSRPSAPYRMDLALTYRCNNDCSHCYNGRERTFPELPTETWKRILDRLWDLGVPHIVFTGGEPTLRSDLPELIAYAESLGQITGLNTNGRRLSDAAFVSRLVDAGLDHVQITVESSSADVHNLMVGANTAFAQTIHGVQNALASPLYVMTNTTMLQTNLQTLPGTLDFLAELGVKTVGLNALIYSGHGLEVGTGLAEDQLNDVLDMAVERTDLHGQRLIWYTPTQYCHFDPTQHNLGVKGCTAALYSMCIEPNGDVLPCQSYYESLGNFLEKDWTGIWNHDLAIRLRERRGLPDKCTGCSLASACGGGCPLLFKTEEMPLVVAAAPGAPAVAPTAWRSAS
jgi:radical SAM protein with 4Fe4S-binding SPASM domain